MQDAEKPMSENIGITWKTSDGQVMLTPTKLIVLREHIPAEPKDIPMKPRTEIPLERIKLISMLNTKDPLFKDVERKLRAGSRGGIIAIMGINPEGKEAVCVLSLHRRPLEPLVVANQAIQGFVDTVQKAITNRNLEIMSEKKSPEEWICSYCQTLNPTTQIDCFHCNAPRKDKK